MAAGRDRYEPLREAARKAQNQKQAADPPREKTGAEKDEKQGATRQIETGTLSPTRPTAIPLPKWTDKAGMQYQQNSALERDKALNKQNKAAHQQAKQKSPAPQLRAPSVDLAQKTKEQKAQPSKDKPAPLENHGRKLRFYEDLNPRGPKKDHEHER